MMADDLDLIRPPGVDPHAWTAIVSHRDHLHAAIRGTAFRF
jgi:hypothetical protein